MLGLRSYTPLRMVLTVCGQCFADDPDREIDYETDILQGNLVALDGQVQLRRICRRGHGEVVSLYEEDVRLWEELQQWRIPTREIVPDRAGNARPIPMGYLDGLGDLQTQHSCVLMLDVTENCNLQCPTCFAVSGPGINRHAQVRHLVHTLDTAIAREGGKIDALMLSGGEPTVHPEIVEIIRAATERKVTRVVLNTNGIRIARDDRFMAELARVRDRVEVYLQFDGFREETHLFHRGVDLREVKAEAIRRLTDARIFTTLAVAVAKGVNDDETGAIVDLAFGTDYIAGIAFQPMFVSGRAQPIDPLDRATTTGTIRRLGEQTGGRVAPDDFIALPCSHPDCSSLTYFIRGDDGGYRSVIRMIGRERLKEQMVLIGNRLAPDDALWESLTGLLSETAMVSRPELIDYLLDVCEVCDLGVSGFVKTLGRWLTDRTAVPVEALARRVKRVSIKTFMDPWTMNVERLQQCCVHVGSTDGDDPVRIPFCARQSFGALRRRTSAGMVPSTLAHPARRPTTRHGRPDMSSTIEPIFPAPVDPAFGPVGPASYPRRQLSKPEKYERLAFTFCRLGTTGLIAWALGPPLFVLIVALAAIVLYARSITLGVRWTKCLLRRPTLIIAFWAVVAAADVYWLVALGGRPIV